MAQLRELGGVLCFRSCRELNFRSVGVSCALLPLLAHVSCRKLSTRTPLLKTQEMLVRVCLWLGRVTGLLRHGSGGEK